MRRQRGKYLQISHPLYTTADDVSEVAKGASAGPRQMICWVLAAPKIAYEKDAIVYSKLDSQLASQLAS